MASKMTITVAQLQSAARKTLGFMPDMEVSLLRADIMDSEIEVDVYHIRNVIHPDGVVDVWALNKNGDAFQLLDTQQPVSLGRRSDGETYHV